MTPEYTDQIDPAAMASSGPGQHLQSQLAALPAGMPAVLMIGTALTLVGTYTGDVELTGTDTIPSSVAARILVAACSCEDPDSDVDPDCSRHYPQPPEELVALIARAVAASRLWEYGGIAEHARERIGLDWVSERDAAAALAVLTVLLQPARHGVFCQEPRPA